MAWTAEQPSNQPPATAKTKASHQSSNAQTHSAKRAQAEPSGARASRAKAKAAGNKGQAGTASPQTAKSNAARPRTSAAPTSPAQTKSKHGSKPEKESAVAAPAPPQTPGILSPLALQQIPATPAQVEYKDGQLTILARNSTLGDILSSVRKQTGADIDFPPNTTERVVGEFGPGPARDVLATLLDGSSFNYVLLGSASHPNRLEKVILTPGSKAASDARPSSPGAPVPQVLGLRQTPAQISPNEGGGEEDGDATGNDEASNDETPDQAVKTPEQLLQELQRQQQILIQQQQPPQGNSPAGTQPNVPLLPPDQVQQGRKERD
jgi:hypothetical protein